MNYIRSDSKEGGWTCSCGNVFRTRRELQEHKKLCKVHLMTVKKSVIMTCPFCKKEWETTIGGFNLHKKYCKENPQKEVCPSKGRKLSEASREQISRSMKKAIEDGRAKGWQSRSRCEHSYPEKWFIEVLKNNFNMTENQDYVCELYFNGFFLDFAWPEKKLCVEIDGNQHYEEDRKAKDLKKDDLLQKEGWVEVRADWSYISKNKGQFIQNFENIFKSLGTSKVDISKYSYKGNRKYEKASIKREALKKEGKVDTTGRTNPRMLTEEDWEARKDIILNSGVDLMKFGWISKVIKLTGLSKREIYGTIKHTSFDCYLKNAAMM